VSTATWTGIPLSILLKEAGLCDSAVEILFEGSDIGHIDDSGNQISFERSLPREKALDDVILAYKMNDHILPSEHGFPLRLVVPGWYGMAWTRSVKRIEAIDYNFNGFYQKERYVYVKENCEVKPVTTMHVNSVITSAKLDASKGSHLLRGRAWSGEGKGYIVEVHVSIDGGLHWSPAQLIGPNERYAWRSWQYHHILKPGEHTISCMAIDSEGNMQPQEVEYNKFGYRNNAVQRLSLLVE